MKKVRSFLLFLFFFITQQTKGDVSNYLYLKKGSWGFGGSLSLNLHITEGAETSLSLTLEPELSYFPIDQFETSLGLQFIFNFLTTKQQEGKPFLTWGLALGPRFYFPNNRVAPYIGGSYGFRMNNFYAESFEFNYALKPGFLYGISPFSSFNFAAPIAVNFTPHHLFKGVDVQTGLFGIKTIIQ